MPAFFPVPKVAVNRTSLARALEASWDAHTAYQGAVRPGNPAYGQCYPTARVVQWFYPTYEIAKGQVRTPDGVEHHFWNVSGTDWLDLSWQQFPEGSVVQNYMLLDRHELGDTPSTVARCALLLDRVRSFLAAERRPTL